VAPAALSGQDVPMTGITGPGAE